MAHSTHTAQPDVPVRAIVAAVLGLEVVLLVGHFLVTPAEVTQLRWVIYPFVWINVALYAVYKIRVPDAPRRHRWVAAAVAGGYFLLLANWAGLIGFTAPGHHGIDEFSLGLSFTGASPARTRITYLTETFYVAFVPFRVIGYLGLAYLLYVALLDVASAVVSGVVGLVSCISCSLPVVASFATSVWGGSVTLMSTVYEYPSDVATVAFVVSVALLYYRPGFGRFRAGGDDDGTSNERDGR